MKKGIAAVALLVLLGAAVTAITPRKTAKKAFSADEYLRIHIRANSDGEADQTVKYRVKDAVTSFLTPMLTGVQTKTEAEAIVKSSLGEIRAIASGVLLENGFGYKSRAKLTREVFPTRIYGDVTFSAGEYDALILELGEGAGANWWCVVYPPLCFTGKNETVEYKSLFAEIFENLFGK